MDDRLPLAKLVEPIDAATARLIADPATDVERMRTPFLHDGKIFRVQWNGPYKPVMLTIGYARPGNFIVFLSTNLPGFNELAAKAGIVLETEEQRVAYAVALLESTRRFDEVFTVLRRFEDVRLLPDPSPEAAGRYRAMQAAYAPAMVRVRSEAGRAGWTVPLYVLSRRDLCLFTVSIGHDGTGAFTRSVLEADTPLLPNPHP